MRAGTSRGPFFHAHHLPVCPAQLDRVLLRVMGSPDVRQIDGIGGATTVTSKVAIISISEHEEADIDYRFAQVDIENKIVDWAPTCGNMLAGVGPFAVEEGILPASNGETRIVIRSVNTGTLVDAVINTPNGEVNYDGDCAIAGVPGTGAPIQLLFRSIAGSQSGVVLPTGNARDIILGVEATCIDVALPMVIVQAAAMGWSGCETPSSIHGDSEFMERMQAIRHEAGRMMGFGDVSKSVLPRFAMVAPPIEDGHFSSRYLTPWQCHAAYSVSGSICVSAAAVLPGSVVDGMVLKDDRFPNLVEIEHPSGSLDVALDFEFIDGILVVHSGGVIRTARRIMAGKVYVPTATWA